MSLFTRLFLTYLGVTLLALGGMFLVVDLLSPSFYQGHVHHMVQMMGPMGLDLRADLEKGLHSTLERALLAALPVATLLAALLAYWFSRRVSQTVVQLSQGAQEIARGRYAHRLREEGPTELADLARQFNHLSHTLRGVEKSRVELISSVAHELRTPLAALQGYTEALTDGVLPPDKIAQQIAREVRAMSHLVDDLAFVSRVEAGAVELHLQVVEVGTALHEAQERFAIAFAEKKVGLEIGPLPQLHPVQADPLRLQQVLSNLLTNALRHTPVGGQVTVGVERCEGRAWLFVRDSGPGIAPEHQARLFERFYRVDPARSRCEGGSGVGLTVARGLVEAMGGEMGVGSEPGKGSTFWFTLPFTEA
ncbi:MAG: two-component sensor histidine kinase [Meiothermus sp.]